MSLWERVRELPLRIGEYTLETLSVAVSSEFTRKTTVIHLQGSGEEGVGEEVTYDAAEHDLAAAAGAIHPLAGSWTLGAFSEHLDHVELFDHEPRMHASRDYRRWAYESAALDLALRQSGISVATVLGREPRTLRFVLSTRRAHREWLALYPNVHFKLDAEDDWTDEVVAELAASGAVDTVDLKGHYRGTVVDLEPDAVLYRRVAEGFPNAFIEDPWLNEETDAALAPYRDRITWDAPIHSVADVDALPFPPHVLNCKPSRFGTVAGLFAFYDACVERGIELYGGGQFELGPGRGQAQLLAALFHPDAPNDIAPADYNLGEPRPGLPESPLQLRTRHTGFLLL
jgi:hypothetical protein